MKQLLLGIGLFGIGALSLAQAGSVSSNLGATTKVANSCVIQTLDSVSFGAYNPTSGMSALGQGQVHLTCTKKAAASAVPSSGGSHMTGPSGSLNYALYTDSGMSQQWGSPAPNYQSINFSVSQPLFAYHQAGISASQCQALSNGLLYAYEVQAGTSPSQCLYGKGSNYNAGPISGSYNTGFVLNGTTVVAPSKITSGSSQYDSMVYYATGSQVGSYTYSVATSMSGALALSGTSQGVTVPLNLTYYAKVPASQDVSAGTYVDTVTVQVTF